MKNVWMWMLLVVVLLSLSPIAYAQRGHRLGAGANYWVALRDIKPKDVDKDGFSYLLSYQYRPTLIGLQADVEFLPDLFGENAIAPAAYLVAGQTIYAALGIGIVHRDGDWADNPFFALKVGLDLEVLPRLYLDIGASYRYNDSIEHLDVDDELKKIGTDTIFLGAAVRFAF